MTDVICNTSPLQYLYQLERLDLLPHLADRIVVPTAVVNELEAGRAAGVSLPDVHSLSWIEIRSPIGVAAERLVTDLGPGETEVLMLGLESVGSIVVLDDALARRMAESLGLKLKGTLGILLNAKRAGFIQAIRPELDRLEALRFRLARVTREAVLTLAGEVEL